MILQSTFIKYPVGIQSFSEIREGGYVYVDKTAFIYRLKSVGKYFFLSRPRRFGKSLLLSTMEAYYQGKRELFKGLALDTLTDDWEPHPVLHFDLNNGKYTDDHGLEEILTYHLSIWEKEYGIDRSGDDKELSSGLRFANIIRVAFEKTGKKVVILIDEYDKPLLNTIGNPGLADAYRTQLKAFYSNLKTMDAYIEIAVLTGVARFSKVSIFSDLNNLRDISFNPEFAPICGVTTDELDSYFEEGIAAIASNMGVSSSRAREELKRHYDGYHFSEGSPDIYNPFSLVCAFASSYIDSYWFESGTPTFLVELIRREQWRIGDIAPVEIGRTKLASAGILSENPVPVLYQTGYLTIKDYDPQFKEYTLDYPNEEVKEGFLEFLVPYYLYPEARGAFSVKNFVKEVTGGKPEEFMKRLESLIAGVPYSGKGSAEAHFQNAIYLLFNLMGFYTRMELRTSDGRIDLKVETDRYIYIFEFKVDASAEEAMRQIEEKNYRLGDAASGKQIFLIGANFDTKTRRLTDTVIKE